MTERLPQPWEEDPMKSTWQERSEYE